MDIDIENKRSWLLSAYPSETWEQKVKKMTKEQVLAVYFSLVKRGKIKP